LTGYGQAAVDRELGGIGSERRTGSHYDWMLNGVGRQ